jgi:hypothetical protein
MESIVHDWDTAGTVGRIAENNGRDLNTTILRHASGSHYQQAVGLSHDVKIRGHESRWLSCQSDRLVEGASLRHCYHGRMDHKRDGH